MIVDVRPHGGSTRDAPEWFVSLYFLRDSLVPEQVVDKVGIDLFFFVFFFILSTLLSAPGSTLPSLSPIIQVKIVQASTEERLALGYTSIPITLT